jgi:hypothetical protein
MNPTRLWRRETILRAERSAAFQASLRRSLRRRRLDRVAALIRGPGFRLSAARMPRMERGPHRDLRTNAGPAQQRRGLRIGAALDARGNCPCRGPAGVPDGAPAGALGPSADRRSGTPLPSDGRAPDGGSRRAARHPGHDRGHCDRERRGTPLPRQPPGPDSGSGGTQPPPQGPREADARSLPRPVPPVDADLGHHHRVAPESH